MICTYYYLITLFIFNCIVELGAERRLTGDNLAAQCSSLKEENSALDSKLKGLKARMQTTEKDVVKYKQQIQLLLNKANTDDELIDALKSEINHLRTTAASGVYKANVSGQKSESSSDVQVEMLRLRRQCKQQADQLNTQDELIRELRGQMK